MFVLFIVTLGLHGIISHAETIRILFGSCSKPYLEQPLWPIITSKEPSIWIWGGDNVYHDQPDIDFINAIRTYINPSNSKFDTFHFRTLGFGWINPKDYDANYRLQNENEGYSKLQNNNKTEIIGIWDDHDFGRNDGDHTHPYKQQSKDAFMRFMNIPPDHPMRKREGIYQFHSFSFSDKLVVDVYLLDVRWFSAPKENILLGNEQWNWLESTIKQRVALNQANISRISLFVSGIQILPQYRAGVETFPFQNLLADESWNEKSKRERIKLIETILNHNVTNPILISGDVHFGEALRYDCWNRQKNEYRSLYEMTSSGLSHSWKSEYPFYLNVIKDLMHYFNADGATMGITSELNFGEIEVVFDSKEIRHLNVRLHGLKDIRFEMDLMAPEYFEIDAKSKEILQTQMNNRRNDADWICMGYDQPEYWKWFLFVVIDFVLVQVGVLLTLIFMTGCGCGGFCCYCSWRLCSGTQAMKIKQ